MQDLLEVPTAPLFSTSLPSPITLIYENRGAEKTAIVSYHAIRQFRRRWLRIYEAGLGQGNVIFHPRFHEDIQAGRVEEALKLAFEHAHKIWRAQMSHKTKKRDKRRGNCGLRFRATPFEFIVQDLTVVTIEICNNEFRHLN